MSERFHPRRQVDLGELAAMWWLARAGAKVWAPLFHSPDVDLIADWGDRLDRIQVKTSTRRTPYGRFSVQLNTHGGNRSWNGTVKYLDPARVDYVFALVGDGRQWFIPTGPLECCSAISLGGPKYAEYEVERHPLGPQALGVPTLDSTTAWGDSRAVKGAGL